MSLFLSRMRRQRGAALLAAIAGAGLLAVLAVEIVGTAQDDIQLAERFREEFRARWALQAPVAMLMAALKEDTQPYTGLSGKWASLGDVLNLDGVVVRFEVHDESAKVNLNSLGAAEAARRALAGDTLKRILRRLNLDASLAEALQRLAEERAKELPAAQGQEKAEPKPVLRSLSELKRVRGFSPAVLRAIGFRESQGAIEPDWSERLTVHSDGRINVNTADPFILRELSEELPEFFVSELVSRRKERPIADLAELKGMPGMTEPLLNKLSPLLAVRSQAFSLTAVATSGRVRKRLTAVLEKGKENITLRYWRIR